MNIKNKHVNLSTEERNALFIEYSKTKDSNIKKILVCANLPLVMSIARKINKITNLSLNDLFQEGVIGLIKAIDYYDYTKGYAFSTFATKIIFNVLLAKAELSLIHLPKILRQNMYKLHLAEGKLLESKNRKPTYEELAKELNTTIDNVIKQVVWSQRIIYFSEKVDDEESEFLVDTMSREEQDRLPEYLDKSLSFLDDRELVVILLNFGFFDKVYSLDKIGELFGFSDETARNIKNVAISKLKAYLEDDIIPNRGTFTIRNYIENVEDEVLEETINNLSDYEKSVLAKRYNHNLSEFRNNKITLNEIYFIFERILPKINNILFSINNIYSLDDTLKSVKNDEEIINNISRLLTDMERNKGLISKKKKEVIEFYITNYNKSLLDIFPKNFYYEIEAAVEAMGNSYINFLTKRLGKEYLENPVSNILEYKAYEKIIYIIKVIENNLCNLNLFMYFPNVSNFEVIEALRFAKDQEIDVLRERFGSDFNTLNNVDTEVIRKSLVVIDYIKCVLSRIKFDKKYQRFKLIDLYPRASEELLKESINRALTPLELNTLYYYFRKELDNGINISNPDIKNVLNKLNNYINRKLGKINICDYLDTNIPNLVNDYISNLTAPEKKIMSIVLGKDYLYNPKFNVVSPNIYESFKQVMNNINEKMHNDYQMGELISLALIKNELKKDEKYQPVIDYLGVDDVCLIYLYLGKYKNINFSLDELSTMFNISSEELPLRINNCLEMLQNKNLVGKKLKLIKQY